MKKTILFTLLTLLTMSGCTQIVTAPISIAGTVVSSTIDVAGSAVGAVIPDGDDEEKEDD